MARGTKANAEVARLGGAHAGDDVSVLIDSNVVHAAHLHVGMWPDARDEYYEIVKQFTCAGRGWAYPFSRWDIAAALLPASVAEI